MRLLLAVSVLACAPPRPVESAPAAHTLPAPSARANRAFLIASSAEALGDLETAERAWLFLSREDRARGVSHAYLARFYERQRRWADAYEAWTAALDRDPRMWEAHEALASLAGRAGDPDAERVHLEHAVESGGSAAVHERLVEVQRRDGDDAAAQRTLERWQSISLHDPIERLHRARAARALGQHDLAVSDLTVVVESDRAADAAPLLWESARQACLHATAWRWARSADVDEPVQRSVVADVAEAVGDAALLERALLGTPDAPLPGDHPAWPAPPLLPAGDGVLRPRGPAVAVVRVAEAWRRARLPARALAIPETDDPHLEPLQRVIRARALVALGRDEEALAALPDVPADHVAAPAVAALRFELGVLDPDEVRPRLADPTFAAAFAAAMTDAVVRGPREGALRLSSSPSADPGILVLAPKALRPWRRAVDSRRVLEAVAAGDMAIARDLARAWTQRDPESADAWVSLALAEPERADRHLDVALGLDPCHGAALVQRGRGAPEAEALGWLDRAREADPLSRVVRRALAQRGLEVP